MPVTFQDSILIMYLKHIHKELSDEELDAAILKAVHDYYIGLEMEIN